MAESPGSGRRAAAGGESLDGEDEEREPLLPRIAWAQPRKSAPGTAVRLLEAARQKGAASARRADDQELLIRPSDSPRCPSRGAGHPQSSPTDRCMVSGATWRFPSPRRSAPHSRPSRPPARGSPPCRRLPSPSRTSTRLVGEAVRQAPRPEPRGAAAARTSDAFLPLPAPRVCPFPSGCGRFTGACGCHG